VDAFNGNTFTLVEEANLRNFTGIQAMRGVAALSVVVGNVVCTRLGMGINDSIALGAFKVLQSGVDVFFVISGFIITMTATNIGETRGRWGAVHFAWNRATRIYPIYWVVLAAAVASSYWITVGPTVFSDKLSLDVILLRTAANYFVSPAWSLYFEVSFYAAATIALLIAPCHFVAVAFAAAGFFIAAALLHLPHDFGAFSHSLTFEFGFGIIIAAFVRRGLVGLALPSLAVSAVLFAIGGYFHIQGPVSFPVRSATFGLGGAFLIYAVVVAELKAFSFPKPLQRLGDMSYSLYICHHLIIIWFANYTVQWLPGPLQMLGWLAASLFLSAAVYYFVERPMLLGFKKIGAWRLPSTGNVASRSDAATASSEAPG
jgi:exopolysaccharide production protein ExoZ